VPEVGVHGEFNAEGMHGRALGNGRNFLYGLGVKEGLVNVDFVVDFGLGAFLEFLDVAFKDDAELRSVFFVFGKDLATFLNFIIKVMFG